jgi:hypothetical protein
MGNIGIGQTGKPSPAVIIINGIAKYDGCGDKTILHYFRIKAFMALG